MAWKKNFKIGEYAIGGIIRVEGEGNKIKISVLNWDDGSLIDSKTFTTDTGGAGFGGFGLANAYYSMIQDYLSAKQEGFQTAITTPYYADKIIDFIRKKVGETKNEAVDNDWKADLKRAIDKKRKVGFSKITEHDDEKVLGVMLAQYLDGNGETILKVAGNAMEEANHYTEQDKIQNMIRTMGAPKAEEEEEVDDDPADAGERSLADRDLEDEMNDKEDRGQMFQVKENKSLSKIRKQLGITDFLSEGADRPLTPYDDFVDGKFIVEKKKGKKKASKKKDGKVKHNEVTDPRMNGKADKGNAGECKRCKKHTILVKGLCKECKDSKEAGVCEKVKTINEWKGKLQKEYANFEEFKKYTETYNLHGRLGFKTPKEAWDSNPTVQGSTDPSDYKVVKKKNESFSDFLNK